MENLQTEGRVVPAQENAHQTEKVIREIIQAYFHGLHIGDTAILEQVFHPDVVLKAPGIRRSCRQWLDLVACRSSPESLGHPFAYEILALEILGDQAMVKVSCPLLGDQFIDFLGLLKEDGRWQIVNKMYAKVPAP